MLNCSTWSLDRTLSCATTLGQGGPGSNGNKRVLRILQSSSITRTSPSDSLMSYTGHTLWVGVLPLCRDAVDVLYSPRWLCFLRDREKRVCEVDKEANTCFYTNKYVDISWSSVSLLLSLSHIYINSIWELNAYIYIYIYIDIELSNWILLPLWFFTSDYTYTYI